MNNNEGLQHDPIAAVSRRAYADEAKRRGYEALAEDLLDWVGRCPIYGAKPHGPHMWTDLGIAGETAASCAGVKRVDLGDHLEDLAGEMRAVRAVRAAEEDHAEPSAAALEVVSDGPDYADLREKIEEELALGGDADSLVITVRKWLA